VIFVGKPFDWVSDFGYNESKKKGNPHPPRFRVTFMRFKFVWIL